MRPGRYCRGLTGLEYWKKRAENCTMSGLARTIAFQSPLDLHGSTSGNAGALVAFNLSLVAHHSSLSARERIVPHGVPGTVKLEMTPKTLPPCEWLELHTA
jgi:hypothetical protein